LQKVDRLKAVFSLASDINQPAIASLIVPVLKNFRILNEDSEKKEAGEEALCQP
jgi:hypothetical protein